MNLTSEVNFDAVVLNGARIRRGEPLQAYETILGPPSRSQMPGAPPPYGHRNNVLHFYDGIGLFLREHHVTCLIEGIDFLFEPEKCYFFRTTSHFSAALSVLGVEVHRRMEFSEFAAQCGIAFKPHLGHAWYVDGERISIQFEVYTPKGKGVRHRDLLSALCVGFRGAHRPDTPPTASNVAEAPRERR